MARTVSWMETVIIIIIRRRLVLLGCDQFFLLALGLLFIILLQDSTKSDEPFHLALDHHCWLLVKKVHMIFFCSKFLHILFCMTRERSVSLLLADVKIDSILV